MSRTVLIADPDDISRQRLARIANQAGYRVLKAQTQDEARVALGSCPISALIIDEQLLRRCDLRELLLRAPVLVLSGARRASTSQDVNVVPKDASASELASAVVSMTGDPAFAGRRDIFATPSLELLSGKWPAGSA